MSDMGDQSILAAVGAALIGPTAAVTALILETFRHRPTVRTPVPQERNPMPDPVRTFRHFRDVPDSLWRWPNFSPAEIACRGTGKLLINAPALDKQGYFRIADGFFAADHTSFLGCKVG